MTAMCEVDICLKITRMDNFSIVILATRVATREIINRSIM